MDEQAGVISRTASILVDLIRGTVHDRHTIAKRHDIAVAAADRYIRALRRVPGVVDQREGRRLSIKFDAGEAVPRPSYAAAVAASWASGLAEVFTGSDYERGVRDALAYVTGRTRRSGEFKHLDRKFIFVSRGGESSLPESGENLDDLIDAVLRERYVVIKYSHFDGVEDPIEVQPLSMAIYDHQIYLVGTPDGGAPYPFRLSRIHSVETPGRSFEYPARVAYDPKQIFRDSLGIFISDTYPVAQVRFRLDKRWVTHARTHRWHPSQRVDELPDSLMVTLVVRLCPELKAWILGFGKDAVVIEPPQLADDIKVAVAGMAANYRAGSRRPPRRAEQVQARPSGGARARRSRP